MRVVVRGVRHRDARPRPARCGTGPSAFFATGRPELSGAGRMVAVGEHAGCVGAQELLPLVPHRVGFMCEDCSLRSDDDRQARYAAALAEEAAS